MSTPPTRSEIDHLMRDAAWIRRVARRLILDESRTDDAVQEAWLAACKNPPRRAETRRAWWIVVTRNAARRALRSERSRTTRERQAARPERIDCDPADIVERAELHELLVKEVLSLAEPYRRVLLWRYVDDRQPAEIAELLGVPPGTVRSQLKRGLDQLRARLDTRHGGSRRTWALALLPIAGNAPGPGALAATTTAVAGGVLMGKVTKVSIAIVLLVLATGAVLSTTGVLDEVGQGARLEEERSASAVGPAGDAPARLSGASVPGRLLGTPTREPRSQPEEAATPDLTVRVLRHGEPVSGAEVVVGNAMAGREEAKLATGRTDADGLARFQTLRGETVGVFAAAPGMGRGYLEVALPREGVVDVEMPDDRTVTIHVRRGDNLEPVAGAEVMLAGPGTLPFPRGPGCLPPLPDIRTDANGDAVVSGLPPTHVWIVARAPGLAIQSDGRPFQGVILRAPETRATVTLWPRRVVRFPIKTTGAGAPEDGTKLALHRDQPLDDGGQGEPTARIEDHHLVLEPFPPGFDWGHVISADGTWALWRVPMNEDLGEPVEFRAIHDIRVRLRWKDGTPATDQILFAILKPRGEKPRVRTDAEGLAVFPECVAESAHIMWSATERGSGLPIARVNLVSDPGDMVVVIDRPIDYAVRIRVNGEPRLPDDYEVHVMELAPDRPPDELRRIWEGCDEAPEKGEIRFRWLPLPGGEASPVTIRAPGLPAAAATPVKGADGIWRATVDLASSTTLRVRIAAPEDTPYFLYLERWQQQDQRYYVPEDGAARQARRDAKEGEHTFRGFAPGRYRLRESYSGITSTPFELTPGGADLDLELDLSTSVLVRGRIVVPTGESPAYATVRFADRDGGSVSRSNPVRVQGDGSYEFRAPAGERHRIVVEHPLLVARDAPPEIVVGSEVPVIQLVEGPQLVFRIEGSDLTTEPDGRGSPAWRSPVKVRMAQSGEWEPEGYGRTTIAQNGRFRVGVPEPGTWDVRVERFGFVPHLVRGVKVGDGPADLGTIALSKGTTLTVRLLKGVQPLPSQPCVSATLVGPMPHRASGCKVEAGDPPRIVLGGLGRGTFRVVVSQLYVRDGDLAEREVVCDGENGVTLDIQLP